MVFLLKEVAFTCATITVKLRGCVAGPATPLETLTKTLTTQLRYRAGVNEYTKVSPKEGEEIECKLEESVNKEPFEQAGLETSEVLSSFARLGVATEVTLMN